MPNRSYVKGRAKEYKIAKYFKEKGFEIAQRTAGSHSPIDVIAINTRLKVIELVQAKPNSMSENQKKEIKERNKKLNGFFLVKFSVV